MSRPSPDLPSDATGPVSADAPGGSSVGAAGRTVTVLLDYINVVGGCYESEIREALHRTCVNEGLNVRFVYGRGLDDVNVCSAPHNALFDLVDPAFVDALIVMSVSLMAHCGAGRMARFVDRYGGRPRCSVGLAIPGVPSVVVDSGPAMSAIIEHVVEHHGRRKVAFLAGTPTSGDSEERLRAYRDVLERHRMPLDPSWVAHGNFVSWAASRALERILEQTPDIDAVVAANDAMAFGAIQVLRDLGRRVPRDVAVTGFDDLPAARLGNPPMTTARQPLRAIGEHAVALVLAQMAGHGVDAATVLGAEPIVRRSCGCRAETHATEETARFTRAMRDVHDPRQRLEAVRNHVVACLRSGSADAPTDGAVLVDGLLAEVGGRSGAFANAVEDVLDGMTGDCEGPRALHRAVVTLHDILRDVTDPRLERVWEEASELITLAGTRGRASHQLELDRLIGGAIGNGERMAGALDLPALKQVLLASLPELGIRTAMLSRFAGGDQAELEPVMCLVDGAPYVPEAPRFPASALIPPGAYQVGRRRSWLVFPLVRETRMLGVLAFEYVEGVQGYPLVRDQIGAALGSIDLHQESLERTLLQERQANAKRMHALTVLAGGVAHDLNNALGPLVALPDILLRELHGLGIQEHDASSLRADIESIKGSSLRAVETIKDLLTLSRQGSTSRAALDLNRVVGECLAGVFLGVSERERRVDLRVQLSPEPLIIHGAEVQLARAVANLVHNAAESTSGNGRVVVSTFGRQVDEPTGGYEAVSPGNYAVITVADNGSGIPREDFGRLFEPFFTTKRASAERGTGLGLAIVHGVVKEHDGYVDVSSTVGEGTSFTIYLPRMQRAVEATQPSAACPPRAISILIVDDDPVQLRTGRRVLAHLGHRVTTLQSGSEALSRFVECARAGRPPCDLVILDMMLNEELDGLDLFERIRRLFPAQRAIVASGHAPTERTRLARSAGLVWLSKPYTPESLTRAVRDALTEGRAIGADRRFRPQTACCCTDRSGTRGAPSLRSRVTRGSIPVGQK